MPLFSATKTAGRTPTLDLGRTPPPPGGGGASAATSFLDEGPGEAAPPPPKPRKTGIKFDADLDLAEIDDRERPGPTWTAKGRELSRSHLVIRTRRMCYPHRRVVAAVHLIDDHPVPLFGRVIACEYDGDGLYKVELELLKVPERPEIADWVENRGRPPSSRHRA